MAEPIDRELEEFRSQMTPPSEFEEGFSWLSLLGALFIGLIMVPGAMYMGLLAGEGIGPAAQWVTVILFLEVARRAQRQMKKAEIFVLFFMVGAAMASPFGGLLWNQFFIRSDAAAAFGVAEGLPAWFAPPPDSISYAKRTFLHPDWLPAIGLGIFGTFFGTLSYLVLGYGLFRLTSDLERLPFPMAPVGAQGVLALAEDVEEKTASAGSWRWRVFSIGGALGLAFGAIYLGLPTISGALFGIPIQIFPIPFTDLTAKTSRILPAVATGIAWDMGHLMVGMVLPFYAMVGSISGLIITTIANPILYRAGLLKNWRDGDDTITTLFKNNVDFYFSFGIGVAIAIALAGFWQVYKSMQASRSASAAAAPKERRLLTPPGRGDLPAWASLAVYFVTVTAYILVSGWLIEWHPGVMAVLCFLGFVYTPAISYVTARLEGMAGQAVEIPMVREASLILSGYQGVKVWFLPIPLSNFGNMTVFYRQCELTGTRFTSIWKAKILLFPIILVCSILCASFIWSLAPIPSASYPYAQRMWELNAANACIMYSSTLGEFSTFEEAFSPWVLTAGAGFGLALFVSLSWMGAPIFLVYGLLRGLGVMPHYLILQFLGALLGRFYFQAKIGSQWRQYVPVLAAGFACGQGLVTMLGIGFTFLSKAVVQLPF